MKTRFSIADEIFNFSKTDESNFEYYESHYKQLGFILDKEAYDVYKDYDKAIDLNEGDRVDLYGFRLVEWKCYDIENDLIIYSLKEE
jgi:hypothetical protein